MQVLSHKAARDFVKLDICLKRSHGFVIFFRKASFCITLSYRPKEQQEGCWRGEGGKAAFMLQSFTPAHRNSTKWLKFKQIVFR